MPRIFVCSAIGELIVLIGAGVLAFLRLDPHADRHILLAVFSLILTCLIQVMAFTYLTVTGKTIAQAVHLAALDTGALKDAKRIKQSLARHLALLILAVVFVTASGANVWRVGGGRTMHLAAAFAVLLAHVFVLSRQYALIVANADLLNRTLAEYARRRAERSAGARPATAATPD